MTDVIDRWCILRMSGGTTLAVVDALVAAGHDVWTPTYLADARSGPSRYRVQRLAALTPGIAFAKEGGLHDLLSLARSPALTYQQWNAETKRMERHGCPHFSVFRHGGRYPRVADRHLDPLRQEERRAQPRSELPAYTAGDQVRVPSPAFGGLTCIVDVVHNRYATVRMQGAMGEMMIKVEMCDLLPAK